MKRLTILTLALALAVGALAAPTAEAGLFKKSNKSKRTEKPEWMKQAQRYENTPGMSFASGVLQQDGWTGWKVDETKVRFAKDCDITTDGVEGGELTAGRQAIIMGPRIGDTIVAWSVRVMRPDFTVGGSVSSEIQKVPSDSSPDCGEYARAPQ